MDEVLVKYENEATIRILVEWDNSPHLINSARCLLTKLLLVITQQKNLIRSYQDLSRVEDLVRYKKMIRQVFQFLIKSCHSLVR